MKKADVFLIISTLIFSLLFYQQTPGINYLIFNSVLILSLCLLNPTVITRRNTVLVMLGAIISAGSILWHNTALAVIMNYLSLVTLAGLSLNPQSSFLVAVINSSFSFLSTFLIRLAEKATPERHDNASTNPKGRLSRLKFISFFVPAVIATFFFILYASANPAISEMLAKINLDFISWGWIKFTLLGFLILFGFFHQSQIDSLSLADSRATNVLTRKKSVKKSLNALALKYELKSGLLLLLLLNLLLFGFHMVDGYFIFIKKFGGTFRHSDYLHQGVNTLITSIVLAILVILYYFRGNINFYKQNARIKNLAYLWVIQNTLLVGTTVFKNFQYIAQYGLTYKRIGVYIYLLLTLIGLVTTLIKINKLKSTWYLVRVNSWIFYGVFIMASLISWDKLITRYNLGKTTNIDVAYLIGLTSKNLPELITLKDEGRIYLNEHEKMLLENKRDKFLDKMKNQQWPSWNYQDQITFDQIK